jgi:hypothetical protein
MYCILLPHSTYFILQFLVFVLFFRDCFGEIMCIRDSYVYQKDCFGEIMCIRDSYVYQKGFLCFFVHESYVRSVRRYCFVRNSTAVPVQLELVILQYIGWCVLIVASVLENDNSKLYLLLLLLLLLLLSGMHKLLSPRHLGV